MNGTETWQAYNARIQRTRERMLARPESRHKAVADQAEYALVAMQAGCHHFRALHRSDYPAFYRQTVWSPYEAPWSGPAADMVYGWTFLDGRRTYRIWGRKGTTRFTDLQIFNGLYVDNMRSLGNLDFSTVNCGPGGEFSVIASPDRVEHENWLPLDASEPFICGQLRDTFWDWESERGIEIHIECLDRPADTMLIRQEDTFQRLLKSGQLVERTVMMALNYADATRSAAGGDNAFMVTDGAAKSDSGASPRAGYASMMWNLLPDEALIITLAPPQAHYWSFQLMDTWWMTLDFSYHQTGLNGHQTETDQDGMVRIVLSSKDPGVANWLDAMDVPVGLCMLRWYDGRIGAAPAVAKVDVNDIGKLLPHARRVAPDARVAAIAARSRASLSRWGY